MRNLFRRLFSRSDPSCVSATWVRQQARSEMRVEFHSVPWNWHYLIRQMKAKERRKQMHVLRAGSASGDPRLGIYRDDRLR